MFEDGPFGRVTEAIRSYIRDERLDIVERFKEQHQALPKVVREFWPKQERKGKGAVLTNYRGVLGAPKIPKISSIYKWYTLYGIT